MVGPSQQTTRQISAVSARPCPESMSSLMFAATSPYFRTSVIFPDILRPPLTSAHSVDSRGFSFAPIILVANTNAISTLQHHTAHTAPLAEIFETNPFLTCPYRSINQPSDLGIAEAPMFLCENLFLSLTPRTSLSTALPKPTSVILFVSLPAESNVTRGLSALSISLSIPLMNTCIIPAANTATRTRTERTTTNSAFAFVRHYCDSGILQMWQLWHVSPTG